MIHALGKSRTATSNELHSFDPRKIKILDQSASWSHFRDSNLSSYTRNCDMKLSQFERLRIAIYATSAKPPFFGTSVKFPSRAKRVMELRHEWRKKASHESCTMLYAGEPFGSAQNGVDLEIWHRVEFRTFRQPKKFHPSTSRQPFANLSIAYWRVTSEDLLYLKSASDSVLITRTMHQKFNLAGRKQWEKTFFAH